MTLDPPSLPVVIWTGLLASSVTLIATLTAVWLQNRAGLARLRLEQAHDAEQRRRERDLDLRRSIFLEAVESAAKLQRAMLALIDLEKPIGSFQSDPLDQAGTLKAHLVGSFETIRAIDEASIVFFKDYLALCEERHRLDDARGDVRRAREEIQTLRDNRQQIFVFAREESTPSVGFQPADPSRDKLRPYEEAVEGIDARVAILRGELAEHVKVEDQRFVDFMMRALEAGTRYGVALAKACVAVRRELEQAEGFPAEEYERHVAAQSERLMTLVSETVARVRAESSSESSD